MTNERKESTRDVLDVSERYGIAGRAAGEAVLEHGRDGARLRPANDAFLLSRIARAVVDALADHPRGAVRVTDEMIERGARAITDGCGREFTLHDVEQVSAAVLRAALGVTDEQ